mmetsp:Transcript_13658/g.21816  ORF Transcript_13658/g.21816 Transcript_13658/m.21816 type:complete len:129 (+) Transcript_13658:63-449(+)
MIKYKVLRAALACLAASSHCAPSGATTSSRAPAIMYKHMILIFPQEILLHASTAAGTEMSECSDERKSAPPPLSILFLFKKGSGEDAREGAIIAVASAPDPPPVAAPLYHRYRFTTSEGKLAARLRVV